MYSTGLKLPRGRPYVSPCDAGHGRKSTFPAQKGNGHKPPGGSRGILDIRPVALTFRPKDGPASYLETDRSNVLFARLWEAARAGESVTFFSEDGRELDSESLAALNCFLRTARTMGRMNMPFDRLPGGGRHRYAWHALRSHLCLEFR